MNVSSNHTRNTIVAIGVCFVLLAIGVFLFIMRTSTDSTVSPEIFEITRDIIDRNKDMTRSEKLRPGILRKIQKRQFTPGRETEAISTIIAGTSIDSCEWTSKISQLSDVHNVNHYLEKGDLIIVPIGAVVVEREWIGGESRICKIELKGSGDVVYVHCADLYKNIYEPTIQ